jgi:hypothetical protein
MRAKAFDTATNVTHYMNILNVLLQFCESHLDRDVMLANKNLIANARACISVATRARLVGPCADLRGLDRNPNLFAQKSCDADNILQLIGFSKTSVDDRKILRSSAY